MWAQQEACCSDGGAPDAAGPGQPEAPVRHEVFVCVLLCIRGALAAGLLGLPTPGTEGDTEYLCLLAGAFIISSWPIGTLLGPLPTAGQLGSCPCVELQWVVSGTSAGCRMAWVLAQGRRYVCCMTAAMYELRAGTLFCIADCRLVVTTGVCVDFDTASW